MTKGKGKPKSCNRELYLPTLGDVNDDNPGFLRAIDGVGLAGIQQRQPDQLGSEGRCFG
jgi:hypothetical protein